jgi:hypothetical protein
MLRFEIMTLRPKTGLTTTTLKNSDSGKTMISPLKPNRERRESGEGVAIDTTFNGMGDI